MNRRPLFSPMAAPAVLSAALALLAGCESFYEGPTRSTSRDVDSRYAAQDSGGSSYDRRYGSTNAADSTQRVTVERTDSAQSAADRTSASTNTRTAASTGGA